MEKEINSLKIKYITNDKEVQKKIDFFLKDWFSSNDTVSVQTSGSTGKPKILAAEKEKMKNSAKMTCDFLNLKPNDTDLLCLPIDYISGKMMLVRSLERNMKLLVTAPSINPLEKLIESIDFCAMTPLQVENSLDKLHLIKTLIIGGAEVSDILKTKIKTKLKENISNMVFETYGMSETLSHIALREIHPDTKAYFSLLKGISIDQDDRGCLIINAPMLNSDILKTNDVVEIIEKDKFRFIGRADNVINSGGAKIFPEQLEFQIKKIIQNEICFVGINDEILGNKLVAVIEEKNKEIHTEIENKINNFPFEKSFHKPKRIIFIDEISRTPNGKVNRPELRKEIMKKLSTKNKN